jgi:hypothetical protein
MERSDIRERLIRHFASLNAGYGPAALNPPYDAQADIQ